MSTISQLEAIEKIYLEGLIPQDSYELLRVFASNEQEHSMQPSQAHISVLTVLVDSSGSMGEHKQAVIDGHQHMLQSLLDADAGMEILIGQILFNTEVNVLQNVTQLRNLKIESINGDQVRSKILSPTVIKLNETNYNTNGFTALYDAILTGIMKTLPAVASCSEFDIIPATLVAILTDGVEYGPNGKPSSKISKEQLKEVVDCVLKNSIISKIVLAGIGDSIAFQQVAKEIGIDETINVTADPKSIRAAFGLFSSLLIEK